LAATQSDTTDERVCSVVAPGGQLAHSSMLTSVLYDPAAHAWHAAPPKPARHRQSTDCTVPVESVVRFGGHWQQLSC
jgi:hypothetical protein